MGLSPILPPAVLDALRSATLSDDGLTLTLHGQLDADTYRRVKKALDTYGGKWNRKAGTHDFTKDFRPHLEHLLAGGKVGADNGGKNPLAFFPTPEPVIREMCKRIWPWPDGSRFLEPSAGEGAIADFLWNRHSVYADCVELDEDRAQTIRAKGFKVVGSDFLQFTIEQPYDYVLMNPPFTVDGDTQAYISHIEHALTCLRPGGDLVAVVPGSFAWLSRKRVAEFRTFCEKHAQSPLQEIAPGAFKASGTDIATCLIHITKPEETTVTAPDFAEMPRQTREKLRAKIDRPSRLGKSVVSGGTSEAVSTPVDIQQHLGHRARFPHEVDGQWFMTEATIFSGSYRPGHAEVAIYTGDGGVTYEHVPLVWMTYAGPSTADEQPAVFGEEVPAPAPASTPVDSDLPFPVSEAELDAATETPAAPAVLPGTPALFAAPLLADSNLSFFRLDQMDAWADQPRRDFDPAKLEELAESIAHKGLLQNLVGRLREDSTVEVIAGGRRYRALKLLADAGRLPPDFTVPVRLQALSDLEALQLATAENVERASMNPLEEADAFARMVQLGAAPEDIALKFGYSLKTIQQRLVLSEGLGEDGRKLYAAGKIGLGQAQVIAQTTGPIRKHVIKAAAEGNYNSTVSALQNLIKRGSFLVEHAKFDVAESGLEIINDLYGDAPARFADPKAALARQLDWVKDRAAKLEKKKEHHFVDILQHDGSGYLSHDKYETYNVPESVRGTVIMVNTATGQIDERRCARKGDIKSAQAKEQAAQRQQASAEVTGTEGAAIRKQGWIDGHEARATALRTALVGDHKRAAALTILMMLEAGPVDLRASLRHAQAVAIPAGIARLKELDAKLGGILQANDHHKPVHPLMLRFGYGPEAEQKAREVLEALLTLSVEELLDIQSVLIAQAVGGWSTYNPVHAPYEFGAKLAADTGAVVKFRLTDEHLKAYPRERLLELAGDAGLEYVVTNASKYPTSAALRGVILEMADELEQRGYVPPIARFPEVQGAPVNPQLAQDPSDNDTPFPVSAD